MDPEAFTFEHTPVPAAPGRPRWKRAEPLFTLGEVLLRHQLVTHAQLRRALVAQKGSGKRLGQVFQDQGVLTAQQVNWALAMALDVPLVDLWPEIVDLTLVAALPEAFCREREICPMIVAEDHLVLAMADPTDAATMAEVRRRTGRRVVRALAAREQITGVLDAVFGKREALDLTAVLAAAGADPDRRRERILQDRTGEGLLAHLIRQALVLGATEVHGRRGPEGLEVRFLTVDGARDEPPYPLFLLEPLLDRIQRVAGPPPGDPSSPGRRGQFTVSRGVEAPLTVYFSYLAAPDVSGPVVTLRVPLEATRLVRTLKAAGLCESDERRLRALVERGQGLYILVGDDQPLRVETCYALLTDCGLTRRETVLVEEFPLGHLAGCRQVAAGERGTLPARYTALVEEAQGLGPQVLAFDCLERIMGEVLDRLCVASLSDTLVIGLTSRPGFDFLVGALREDPRRATLFASTLKGILLRDRLRLLCPDCATPRPRPERLPPAMEARLEAAGLGAAASAAAVGCARCGHGGYRGHVDVTEVIEVDGPVRRAVADGRTLREIRHQVLEPHALAISREGLRLFRAERTSMEELMRVLEA